MDLDQKLISGYALLDSGQGEKLEKFGDLIIRRPSSLAIWRKRRPEMWSQANATFQIKSGWQIRGKKFEEWRAELGGLKFVLRLQKNGQIGVFPEHHLYLESLKNECARLKETHQKPVRVLNLFAYTGAATIALARIGASVCHVDLSKSALNCGRTNLSENGVATTAVQLIEDDALKYAAREKKRGQRYGIVIADPPSFSRVSKEKSWQLEKVVSDLIEVCLELLEPQGLFVLSAHDMNLKPEVLANLISDYCPDLKLESTYLFLRKSESTRVMPAGYMVWARSREE